MEAYLDNSATTRCSERAKNKMVQILTEDYGNPSSLHNMGKTAEDYIKEAKEHILDWHTHTGPVDTLRVIDIFDTDESQY